MIWFAGTGQFAALCLENLTRKNITFGKIITGLPTRSGRNGKENPSHVEIKASELGLNVTRTGKLTENLELINELEKDTPEIIFVIDFGQIIREPFLSSPKYGCLNIHPSLLPEFRGAAPVQRSLLEGKKHTGVTVFRLVKAMDAGEILAQSEIEIKPGYNASDLYKILAETGSNIAADSLSDIAKAKFTPQKNELATYAPKLEKNEFEVSFSMNAEKFCNTVRALDMSGGAYIIIRNRRVKLWRVSLREDIKASDSESGIIKNLDNNPVILCRDFAVELIEVQNEGKKIISGREWSRGMRLKTGDIL